MIHVGKTTSSLTLSDSISSDPRFIELNKLRGAVVGSVELIDCRRMAPKDAEVAFHQFGELYFSWVLRNPQILESPIQYKGRLGLFSVDINDEKLMMFRK